MSAYREPGVPSSVWFRTADGLNAIRISQIRTACFYESDKDKEMPCTVTFLTGTSVHMTRAEGLALLRVLND